MSYKIILSEHAKNDLKSIYNYIAFTLIEPAIAAKKVRQILTGIENLKETPKKFKVYVDEPMYRKKFDIFLLQNISYSIRYPI